MGQFLLDYGPWFVFTTYTYSGKLVWATPTPIKGLWLNFYRWKPVLFSCARSKALLSRGQVLLDYAPWLIFTIYTHSMENLLCAQLFDFPWLIGLDPICDKFPVVGALCPAEPAVNKHTNPSNQQTKSINKLLRCQKTSVEFTRWQITRQLNT